MAVTDHASNAAAVAAGWVRVQIDRGTAFPNTSQNPRFITRYEKTLVGAQTTDRGDCQMVEGSSTVDQATADTNALANLNTFRRHYYAGSPGRASGSAESPTFRGGTQTADVT